ncbi:hypothetical protein Dxin01_03355 [Deinococcus xinjiangensis]|uniref:Transposase IS4-like domain-containing protein n=1 Tax=Deinococcus xinjiangensis TaxID=457454 RepID=A0ABP9VED2_9DEIO
MALSQWGDACITLALDTSRIFTTWCLVCVSMTYRGRAIPLAWTLIRHSSATVSFAVIRRVLVSALNLLSHLPFLEHIRLDADRGFNDLRLMALLSAYGWHWNIRSKGHFVVYDAQGKNLGRVREQLSQHGTPVFLEQVYITKKKYGPVNLAAYFPPRAKEPWLIVSNQPCGMHTFQEFRGRFQIEENFLDLKSGGFHLEDTALADTSALDGLMFVLALATIFVVGQGVRNVDEGERESVDPHSQRGLSYPQIGWRDLRRKLSLGQPLCIQIVISPTPDPAPSRRPRSPPVTHSPPNLS